MPNDPITGKIKCPYYRKHFLRKNGSAGMICEETGASWIVNVSSFSCQAKMENWIGRRCATFEYGKCPIARANQKKAEEKEGRE